MRISTAALKSQAFRASAARLAPSGVEGMAARESTRRVLLPLTLLRHTRFEFVAAQLSPETHFGVSVS
jgi:hypothetical protein